MKLKFISKDYVPKGQLEGFPLEIIDKMIERQVEQGNKPDVTVFEKDVESEKDKGGFDWNYLVDSRIFWNEIINYYNFDLFFEKYPKQVLPLPRVIEVRYSNNLNWVKRVCFAIKNGKAFCWNNAQTLEESEIETAISDWKYWREVQEEPEYKPFDFSKGIENHLDLLGKKIIHKDDKFATLISILRYDEINETSLINDFTTYMLFKDYVFEDGSPVGVKIS